ncbi:MAG: hypothetical protein DRI94_12550 [Bacteroidetes bacterium]|nr:MAG: hypothetical protein DRI94_12550 [Bacteroidota bacterium]
MKTLITIFSIIIFSLPAFSDTENIEQQLKNANQLYAQDQFEEAIKQYEQIISENYTSPTLFFNTANAYYRLNEIGKAIYYYEKAKMLIPNNDDINYNLELAKLRVKNLPPEVPEIFPVRLFRQITFWKSYPFWGILSLGLFILFLLTAYFYFTAKTSRVKKIRLLSAVFVLFFSISAFVFMQYQLSILNAHNQAIVISKEDMAKSSPDTGANDLFKVYQGYKVKVNSENGEWYEITLTDGRKAWLKKEDLKVL